IYVMLLVKDFFQGFTNKPVVDAKGATASLIALSCESRAEVDYLVARASAAGGSAPRCCWRWRGSVAATRSPRCRRTLA
ncbi:VOC family protein, partial [Achromobacter insuavis]|uniref:VOC family protein n=1 Tax=Achromobacter insuavis TaxID=1287735 RepID=UPI003D2FCA98